MYAFEFRTGRVSIDSAKCAGCPTFACVKACSLYGSGILRVEGGRPALSIPLEETRRRCLECLACEVGCWLQGRQAVTISLPMAGLEEYRRGVHGHSAG